MLRVTLCVCAAILGILGNPLAAEEELPPVYTSVYPVAKRFCPPLRTAFIEAPLLVVNRNGRTYGQRPNGGFGHDALKVGGTQMYHTGADLGWHLQDHPVYAIANGVVRQSHPSLRARLIQSGRKPPKTRPVKDYGNAIIIEHTLEDGSQFVSLYAHLADERLVRAGDLVTAGQMIGAIGSDDPRVNGGYEPHLHFAVRYGASFEPGDRVFSDETHGQFHLVTLDEESMIIRAERDGPGDFQFLIGDSLYTLFRLGDREYRFTSMQLWNRSSSNTPGFAPSLDGFADPLQFLTDHGARSNAAPWFSLTQDPVNSPTMPIGRPAPLWNVTEWVNQPAGTDIGDFGGKTVCLFCFQAACGACADFGFTAFDELRAAFSHRDDVVFVALQTPFQSYSKNTQASTARIAKDRGWTIPVGRVGEPKTRSPLLDEYGVRATPWIVVIDRQGLVQFSNGLLPAADLAPIVERLRTREPDGPEGTRYERAPKRVRRPPLRLAASGTK